MITTTTALKLAGELSEARAEIERLKAENARLVGTNQRTGDENAGDHEPVGDPRD